MVTTSGHRQAILFLGLLCACVGHGCGADHWETTFDVLDGVKYRVLMPRDAGSFTSRKGERAGQEVYTWDNGKLRIELALTRPKAPADKWITSLKVDERAYGTLQPGDDVVIDGRRAVKITVNGVERAPQ
jgi:hypothetical protein